LEADWQGKMSRESANQMVFLDALDSEEFNFLTLGAFEAKRTRRGQKTDRNGLPCPST